MTRTITRTEAEALIEGLRADGREVFVRASAGIEFDQEAGFVSRNWCEEYDEDGLSVVAVPWAEALDRAIYDARDAAHDDTVIWLMTARMVGECADGWPLVAGVTPVAIIED